MKSFRQYLGEGKKTPEWSNEAYSPDLPIQPGQDFHYHRRTGSAPKIPKHVHDFGQDIEPHGRYMNHSTASEHEYMTNKPFPGVETGTHRFNKPLYIHYGKDDHGNDASYDHPNNWKQKLSSHFGSKGRNLSKKIIKAGYDGVVTVKDNRHSEIVDLSTFK